MSQALEKNELRLGFIPLADCAPLVVAHEKGMFQAEGLEVSLSREVSWANVRDKVTVGALDGGHMLAPIALACTMGAGGPVAPMVAPLSLNANGSSITVSTALAEQMRVLAPDAMGLRPRTARPLKRLINARAAQGLPPLTFAVVFPFSIHNYLLRYWLAEARIDPDHDVRLTVVPPPRMAAQLASGAIDGFCVGAPWGALVAAQGIGEMLIHTSEIWLGAPDKVLGLSADWASRHPNTLLALCRAVLRAAEWADVADHRAELAAMLASPDYVDAPEGVLRESLLPGLQSDLIFSKQSASFPWRSQALWLLSQMKRWGQIPEGAALQPVAKTVYRPDLYRQAAAGIVQSAQAGEDKAERSEHFFDRRAFDPARIDDYLAGFAIRRPRPPTE